MLALLCGGQGLLSPEVFRLVEDAPAAGAIFDHAQALLGQDPRSLVRTADPEALAANRVSQILTVTAALAVHACIADVIPGQVVVAGYSVGEMAAWSIAGAWSAEAALNLTDARARAMDAVGGTGGRLAYVRGLARAALEPLAARRACAIAIANPGDLFVVGGAEAAVRALCSEALAAGAARADVLSVKVASHTPALGSAVAPFQQALEADPPDPLRRGRILLSGRDGARVFDPLRAIPDLAVQVATPLDWAATLEALVEVGADTILDLGPGHALAEMARLAFPAAAAYSVDQFHGVSGLRGWMGSLV